MSRLLLRQRLIAIAAAIALLLGGATSAMAQTDKRIAFVIGNAAYRHAPALVGADRDAQDVAAALERLGFDVTRAINADLETLRAGVSAFQRNAASADAALVFYAGYALRYRGSGHLVPVDATLRDEASVEWETVQLLQVVSALSRAKSSFLVIEGCGGEQLAEAVARIGGGISAGFGEVGSRADMLIATSAPRAGEACGGAARNLLSASLLAEIEQPGVEATNLFRRVQQLVAYRSGGAQGVEVAAALSRGFGFAAGESPYAAFRRLGVDPGATALRAYVERYGDHPLAAAAKTMLAQRERAAPPGRDPWRGLVDDGWNRDRREKAREARLAALNSRWGREDADRQAEIAAAEQRRQEQERIARERAERERIAREQEEERRRQQEAAAAEQRRQEQERVARERAEQERIAREQDEERKRQQEAAERRRVEQERLAREQAEREQRARIAREQEDERKRQADAAAAEQKRREEQIAAEQRLQAELAAEMRKQTEAAAAEQKRQADEAAAAQRRQTEAVAAEQRRLAEVAAAERQRIEQERATRERDEQARFARDQEERRKQAEAAAVADRQRAEQDRVARERVEREDRARMAREQEEERRRQADAAVAEQRRAEQDRVARERAEREERARVVREQEEERRRQAEQAVAEQRRVERERVAREQTEREQRARQAREEEERRRQAEAERRPEERTVIASVPSPTPPLTNPPATQSNVGGLAAEEVRRFTADQQRISREQIERERRARGVPEEFTTPLPSEASTPNPAQQPATPAPNTQVAALPPTAADTPDLIKSAQWDPLESTCRHASLSIL